MGKNTMHKSQTKLFIFMIGLFVFVVNEKDWIHNKETVVTYTEESFNFILGYGTQKPYLDFVLEIPIPPPELV